MGFYQVTPGSPVYAIGTPLFPKVSIHLENGKTFSIKAEGLNGKNFYIQSANLNGVPYTKCYITHFDILDGGELRFFMGPSPQKNWGSLPGDFPSSSIRDNLISPVPSILNAKKNFTDTTTVYLTVPVKNEKIYFTLDGSEPTKIHRFIKNLYYLIKLLLLKAFACLAGSTLKVSVSHRHFRKDPKKPEDHIKNKIFPAIYCWW